jgi:acyl-CoA thioesterase YciA
VVTAAVKEMSFAKPMKIGDTLCIYTTHQPGSAARR